jgi:hypothetical protein
MLHEIERQKGSLLLALENNHIRLAMAIRENAASIQENAASIQHDVKESRGDIKEILRGFSSIESSLTRNHSGFLSPDVS